MVQEEVIFYGHTNIRSLHPRTIEVTKDENLTLRGDCIVGVRANKSSRDLDQRLQRLLKDVSTIVKIELLVGSQSFKIRGHGSREFLFFNTRDIVIRKSNFVCARTILVGCDKASKDIHREMIYSLQNTETKGIFRITVE